MAASMSFCRALNSVRTLVKTVGRTNASIKRLSLSQTRPICLSSVHFSGTDIPKEELKKKMELLGDKFAEARELLADARESMGTVYFSEDMDDAAVSVEETLKEYQELQQIVSNKQRQELVSTLGLRMEELKAQQAAIEETLKD